MRKFKIIHIVHALEVGGLENGVVNVINNLDPGRYSHAIICLIRSGVLAKRIVHEDVAVRELGLEPDGFKFPVIRLAKMFREMGPDIVHTRAWGTTDAILAARLATVPRVIHGEHGRHATDPHGRNRKRNVLRRCLSPLVDRFMTVSDDLRRWMIDSVGIAPHKVVRIHNGVDIQKFSLDGRAAARRKLGLGESVVAVVTIGRLDPVKDHSSLLRAFATVKDTGQPMQLLIVGDGPMRAKIESQIKELKIDDHVRVLGERHDVAEVLKACDAFALTSVAEGISNTILEAMASGLPIIATHVGGNPEIVGHNVNGQLVNPGDVNGIAAALSSYAKDFQLRQRHGAQARLRAEQDFSLQRMAQQYDELYMDVLRQTARPVA